MPCVFYGQIQCCQQAGRWPTPSQMRCRVCRCSLRQDCEELGAKFTPLQLSSIPHKGATFSIMPGATSSSQVMLTNCRCIWEQDYAHLAPHKKVKKRDAFEEWLYRKEGEDAATHARENLTVNHPVWQEAPMSRQRVCAIISRSSCIFFPATLPHFLSAMAHDSERIGPVSLPVLRPCKGMLRPTVEGKLPLT
jgi:hypothetical protein